MGMKARPAGVDKRGQAGKRMGVKSDDKMGWQAVLNAASLFCFSCPADCDRLRKKLNWPMKIFHREPPKERAQSEMELGVVPSTTGVWQKSHRQRSKGGRGRILEGRLGSQASRGGQGEKCNKEAKRGSSAASHSQRARMTSLCDGSRHGRRLVARGAGGWLSGWAMG